MIVLIFFRGYFNLRTCPPKNDEGHQGFIWPKIGEGENKQGICMLDEWAALVALEGGCGRLSYTKHGKLKHKLILVFPKIIEQHYEFQLTWWWVLGSMQINPWS